jgi:hypothetical protein
MQCYQKSSQEFVMKTIRLLKIMAFLISSFFFLHIQSMRDPWHTWIAKNSQGISKIHHEENEPAIFSWARSKKHIESLKKALIDGADPDHDKKFAGTLLQIAAQNNNTAGIEILLEYGADINKVGWTSCTTSQGTPLAVACRNLHSDSVELLLQKGAHPNYKGDCSYTALMATCIDYTFQSYSQRSIIKRLLLYRADPYIKDGSGKTILQDIDHWHNTHTYAINSHYIEQTQQRLIAILTKLLSRGTVAGIKLPHDMVKLIVSYCYPHEITLSMEKNSNQKYASF